MPARLSQLIAFDSDSAEFARGFELGRIWALVEGTPDATVEEYAHVKNAEMVMRVAEALRRGVSSEEIGAGWMLVRFEPLSEEVS